jgi:uncharacterized circularly permuted ATP-grasp superfamily protein/uncharacterized alpha-E superfamily protein
MVMNSRNQPSAQGKGAPAALPFREARAAGDAVRDHWRYMLDSLNEMGPDELALRQLTLERILRDDGATYNDYSQGLVARPWELDPVPLLLESSEWNQIESGVRERAELLNLVLRDLYGPRTLLKHGVIPAELVYSHAGFLRECQGVSLPGEQQLILYATDIVRTPDGEMRVMSDRAQTPSGTGYALVNRLAMSRVFPSLFRDSHVHRLSLYFNNLRLTLNALNPNGDVARVAVLTPGTYNETYFEHVFLANQLGYPLVQGGDLTVRDGYVWMKTLDGLTRIDVILRRVDDWFCDPVELYSESRLGVPGLLEVARMGNVAIANPLGCGVLENRGLARYLPAAAQHFLGRDLALKTADSWWCGDPADREFVLENLDSLVIKPTFRGPKLKIVHGATLDDAGRDALAKEIRANPLHYSAQEYLSPSLSPVWTGKQFEDCPLVLRSFAVAGESSYVVMPGGLTRIGLQPEHLEISNRLGALSKDTWILASEPEKREEIAASGEQRAAGQTWAGMELPSRVVENLYWVGRYTERAEAALRLLRTVYASLHSEQSLQPASRALLLRAVTHMTGTYPGFLDASADLSAPTQELVDVVLNGDRAGSVSYSLAALLGAVDQVRDFMSADTQRILNDLRDEMARLPGQLQRELYAAPEEALDRLVSILLALSGLAQESMVRGQGWHFLDLGRRIERGLLSISLLRSLCVPAASDVDQVAVLETIMLSAEALMTYRRRYQRNANMEDALDLLMLDPDNPRSLVFQLDRIEEHLQHLPRAVDEPRMTTERRQWLEATTQLRLANLPALAAVAEGDALRADLDQLLSRVQSLVAGIGETVTDRYFKHTDGLHPMSPTPAEETP